MSQKNKWVGEIPKCCDLCKEEIVDVFVDGRIGVNLNLPWGIMCEPCHLGTEVPLKWGHGQKYKKTDNDWLCVEGLEIIQ